MPCVPVTGHETLVEWLTLPDADDRHVLADAIGGHTTVLVPHNGRDLPVHVPECLLSQASRSPHPDSERGVASAVCADQTLTVG